MSDDFEPDINEDEGEDSSPLQGVSDAVKSSVGKQIGNAVKSVGKKVAKVGANVAKKAFSVIGKMIMSTLMAILPYLLAFLGVVLLIAGSYYFLFETRGTDQKYTFEQANPVSQSTSGNYDVASALSPDNNEVKTFYDYNHAMSYYQVLDKNGKPITGRAITKDDLVQTQGTDHFVHDFYNREDTYALPTNLLFSLDEYLYKTKFRYPEQFRQPVNFDGNTLTLKNLTNDKGQVDVDSKVYDPATGKLLTGKTVKSVADYGLGTIYTYKEATQTDTIEGYITSYQVHTTKQVPGPKGTSTAVDVVTKQQTHQPYNVVMKGYPKTVDLLDKAITFVGEFQFNYHIEKVKVDDLHDGYDSADDGASNEPYTEIKWGTYVDVNGNTQILKAYREGSVYQTMPVPDPTTAHTQGNRYINDYLSFFEANVPLSVMQGFDFSKRVDQTYLDNTDTTTQTGGVQTVKAGGTDALSKSIGYLNIVKQYASQYGIDPYLVCAQIARESGGNPNVNADGLMQITGSGARTVHAKNTNGTVDYFTISGSERQDPDKAIHWAVIYDAELAQMFGGDELKMIQAYNLGDGSLAWIRDNFPSDWNTPNWMNHRQQARDHFFPTNPSAGDVNYIEHVLAFYQGPTDYKNMLAHPSLLQQFMNTVSSVFDSILDYFKHDYKVDESHTLFQHYASENEIDWILHMVPTMDKETLFSDNTATAINFWDDGYSQAVSTYGISKEQLLKIIPNMNSYSSPIPSVANPIVTSPFGPRGSEFHTGIDLGIPIGTPVDAISSGIVKTAKTDTPNVSYGNYVLIQHTDGTYSLYAHLSQVEVKAGQSVTQGQEIGKSGNTGNSTGPHLHFELRDTSGHPVEPKYVIANGANGSTGQTPSNSAGLKSDFSNAIFIGDSITYGFENYGNTPVKADHVYAKIGAHVFEGAGLLGSGNKSSDPVDYVFIMFGANDYGYPMSSYESNYKALVEHVKGMYPKATIVLQSVMPMNNTSSEPNRSQEPAKVNQVVKQVASEENVRYLDVAGSIPNASSMHLSDGLHFTSELYPLWANVLKSNF